VAAAPISKHRLLQLIAQVYGKRVDIAPCEAPVIDRSLDGSRFSSATGYVAPPWPELVRQMHDLAAGAAAPGAP
jgi:dTDP-4-dehydrorhamnose reductase